MVPEIVGVGSLSVLSGVSVNVGGVVSMTPFPSATVVVLPSLSVATTSTVYGPSTSAAGTSAEKFPLASTVALNT